MTLSDKPVATLSPNGAGIAVATKHRLFKRSCFTVSVSGVDMNTVEFGTRGLYNRLSEF